MSRWSIRWQLTLWYALALSIVIVAFSVLMYATMRSYMLARIDAELLEESRELEEELELAKSEQEFRKRFQERYAADAIFGFRVAQMDGTPKFGSPWLDGVNLPCPETVLDLPFRALQNLSIPNRHEMRLLGRVISADHKSQVIYILVSMEQFENDLRTMAFKLIMNGLIAILIAAAIGYWIAVRVMAPIAEIAHTAERISSETLAERVPIKNPNDELGRLAATLNHTFDRLQRSVTEMRRFTADAAHELRTPLTVIRTEAEVALRGEAANNATNLEQFHRVAEVTLTESTRLSNLVDQLLVLSRQEAGLQPPRHEEVALQALLLDVIDTLKVVIDTKSQTLVATEISDCTVMGDDISLSQLFFNLIDNAVKYTQPGGTITISCVAVTNQVQVVIADTGVGIDRQHLDHIFERFYRIEPARTDGGAGLGLAICQSIVSAHHGELRVESDPGHGSRFTVFIPTALTVRRQEPN